MLAIHQSVILKHKTVHDPVRSKYTKSLLFEGDFTKMCFK